MKRSHTQGPWAIEAYETGIGIVAIAEDACVAIVADQSMDLELDEANAQLIASAPDLLQALQDILNVCDTADANHINCSQALDTIRVLAEAAKTRGEL